MEFETVECRRKHIKKICKNLRDEDCRELAEMSGNTPLQELLRCRIYSKTDQRWAIVSGEKVLMVYGFYKSGVASSVAKMWMACSEDVSLANRFIAKEICIVIINALMRYQTLTGDIDRRHEKAVGFFKKVGCVLTETKAVTGLPIYSAVLNKKLFVMSDANKLIRLKRSKVKYIKE